MFRKDALIAGVILVIAFAVYWPLLDGTFLLWDDVYNLTRNPHIQTHNPLAFWQAPHLGLFLPVTYSVWYFIWHFISTSAATFHLLNILFHAANASLIFWLLQRRSVSFWSTTLASLIFLLHPLQTESVAWISDFRTLLATFLALAALHFFLDRRRFAGAASLFLVSGSMLAKPVFIFLPVAVWIDFMRSEKERKVNHTLFAGAVLLATMTAALIGWSAVSQQPAHDFDPLSRAVQMLDSFGWLIAKIFWPRPLLPDYSRTFGTIVSNAHWVRGLVIAIATTIALFFLGRKDPRVRLGWLILVACWLPISGIVHFRDLEYTTVADRYGYGLMVGVAILLASFFERMGRVIQRSSVARTMACLLAVIGVSSLGFLSFQQSLVWQSDEKLFSHVLENNPSSFFGHLYLGQALVNQGDLADGLVHLETARKLKPLDPRPLLGLMLAKTQAHDYGEVIRIGGAFLTDVKAVEAAGSSPIVFEILSTLGYNLMRLGRGREAHKVLCHALQSSPLGQIDRSTQENLRTVEELMKADQKPFQSCRY